MANWSDNYYYQRLSADARRTYEALLGGWLRMDERISLRGIPNIGLEALEDVALRASYDHPEMFWPNYYAFEYMQEVPIFFANASPAFCRFNYFFDPQTKARLQADAQNWRLQRYAQIPSVFRSDDHARLWLLYDYLARQVTYEDRGISHSHTIVGCFLPKNFVAVCEGIAKGFKYLCDGLGLPCIVVGGDLTQAPPAPSGAHCWNIVSCRGQYRHLDVTAELMPAKQTGKATYEGFLKTDAQMRAAGYHWASDRVPACL